MAQVFRALDTSTGRRVALKLLQPRAANESLARGRELFQLEFHTLVQLAHPRIVSALDYGETDAEHGGQPYYTMELLAGGDLRERSPLPWQQACAIAHDLCSALSLLHSRRMVYRDLSPRNVLTSSDGTAKLIDFGAMAPMGTTQAVVCTPTVASPELVYRQAIDGRSDLYALGSTLYFMLVGRTPYPVRSFQELPEQWKQPPLRICELLPDAPPALDALVMELLQLDPQLRPGSAAEVAQRLSAIAALAENEQLPFSQAYLTTPELVGRERELAALRGAIARMRSDGRGASVLLRGARGVGRSRLLDASVLAGKLAGLAVVHVACAGVTRGPHAVVRAIGGQLLEMLPSETQRAAAVHAPVLHAILPALRASAPEPAPTSQADGEAERGTSAALRELVIAVARNKPLVLAIDDVERCDLQSLAVIALLAQETGACPLLLIASEAGRDDHASDGLRMLADACKQVVLSPLDGEQTQRLLASVFGDVPNLPLLVRRLHGVAAGNPQDLLHLCQHLLDRGVLGYRAGSWVLPDRLADFELPGSMAQAFASSAQALDPDARALGQAFAACPDEAFTLDECVALCGHGDRLRAFAAIDGLLAAGILVVRDVRYALAAEEWVAALSAGEPVADLHARLAHVFLARKDGLRASRHLLAASSHEQAIDALLAWSVDSYRDTVGSAASYVALIESLPAEWLAIFTAACALCRVLGRSQHDVYVLERRATTLIGQFDLCSDGLHAAYAQRLARCAGLDVYEARDPALPIQERLQRALGSAAATFAATPERDRVLDPGQAIAELARAIIAGISSCTRALDVEEWSQLPSLAALAPLSPAVAVIDQLARGFNARLAGRFEHACEIYGGIVRMLAQGDGAGVDPTFRDTVLGALLAVTGTIDAVLGRAAAETAAATVEHDPLYSGSALAIRLLYRLWQGDLAAADALARKGELWRLENARQDGGDAATVLWILPAHAASDDLTRTRHCLEAIERKSARMRTWQPIASWARAEYERIRGDLVAACDAADDALARLPAGKHPVWPLCAGTRLKVLCAQRRFAEARSDGERDLQLALATGLGFASNHLRMPLAIACAELGEHEAAFAHARAAIETCEALGASGLMLGLAYECAADVAGRCGDEKEHDRYARMCKRVFLAFPNPALAAKYQRLVRAARRARVSSEPAASQPTQDAEFARAQVESLLMTCSERDERLQRALALLIASAGAAGGVLYTRHEHGLQAQAVSNDGPLPAEVAALASRHFESTFDSGGDDDTVYDGGTASAGMWTSAAGRSYRPLLLSHRDQNRLVITGLVVLSSESPLPDETALVASELSRMFAARGDLIPRTVS
jgi:hypothetical protein